MDYSDLFDIMSFFEGAPDGSTPPNHGLAKAIGDRGKEFVKDRWREEDLQSFGLLQLLEVSPRLSNIPRPSPFLDIGHLNQVTNNGVVSKNVVFGSQKGYIWVSSIDGLFALRDNLVSIIRVIQWDQESPGGTVF